MQYTYLDRSVFKVRINKNDLWISLKYLEIKEHTANNPNIIEEMAKKKKILSNTWYRNKTCQSL